jgi:hypothetical protein
MEFAIEAAISRERPTPHLSLRVLLSLRERIEVRAAGGDDPFKKGALGIY